MIEFFKKVYAYKTDDFPQEEISRIKIGRFLSIIGFIIGMVYTLIYLNFVSFSTALLNLFFACSFLLYFYFLYKNQIIKACFFILVVFITYIFFICMFFLSNKIGTHYYFLVVPTLAYLLFRKEYNISFFLSFLSFLFLIYFSFNEGQNLVPLSSELSSFFYILHLSIIFIILIISINVFLFEMKNKEEILDKLANIDYLTGILNRRAFYNKAEALMKLSQRYGDELGLVLFDIDFFKKINDTYGHNMGDIVLKEISKKILLSIRDSDCFARYGGEEFIVLLPNITKDKLQVFAEKIRGLVENMYIENSDGKEIKVTISLGISFSIKNDTIEDFIKRADLALYDAKKSGRNRICISYSHK
ncbi:GGDEF domain-containing protein [Arcobacter sp. s6]|uniref:GGDEF domain-containing protein n=1 Tax=Arcobacter sp. s6 TaxID=3230363 RepID=UPI00349FD4C6